MSIILNPYQGALWDFTEINLPKLILTFTKSTTDSLIPISSLSNFEIDINLQQTNFATDPILNNV